ncbi:MAG: hypothetical protein ACYDCO_12515 [Armatimonadota bacterium]
MYIGTTALLMAIFVLLALMALFGMGYTMMAGCERRDFPRHPADGYVLLIAGILSLVTVCALVLIL